MSVQSTIDFPVRKRATPSRRKIVVDVDEEEKENSPTKKIQIERPITRRSMATRPRKMTDSTKMELESIITALDITLDTSDKTSKSEGKSKKKLVTMSTNEDSTLQTIQESIPSATNHAALITPPKPSTNQVFPPTSTKSPTNKVLDPQVNYKKTKQVLHTSIPDLLVGRQVESDEINEFLLEHVELCKPGSVYISGAPGTGKTAVLMKIVEGLTQSCIKVIINCMTHKNSQSIFNAIRFGISEADKKSGSKKISAYSKDAVIDIEEYITKSKVPVIMIFDEIDSLDSRNQEVLYTIFEWPALKNSKLVLLGVANSLDLTDRVLPRLLAREKCKPKLINFPPYSRDEIYKIIWERLEKLGAESAFDRPTIVFCASKLSSMSGDLRKALDVCRRAVDIVEIEKKNGGSDDPTRKPKKVGLPVIQKVINEVYGSKVVVNESQLKVPLQQMLAICTLLLMGKNTKASKEVNFAKLHENYARMCKKNGVTGIERSEFMSLCVSIEDQGLVNIKKAKEVRLYKVSLRINEKDLESSIHDKALFSTILSKGLD